MGELKSSTSLLWFGGFIVTPALSPIDTSGNVPGEGQICCRIKLIYQMIECGSKATLWKKCRRAHGHPSTSDDTWMAWLIVCVRVWGRGMLWCKSAVFLLQDGLTWMRFQHNLWHIPACRSSGVLDPFFLNSTSKCCCSIKFWRCSFKSRQPDIQPSHHVWIYSISSRRESSAGYRLDGDGERWLCVWQLGRRGLLCKTSQNIFSTLAWHVNSAFCSRSLWFPKYVKIWEHCQCVQTNLCLKDVS